MYAPNGTDSRVEATELEYELLTTHIDDSEEMSYTTYGICVRDARGEVVLNHADISTSKKYVQDFINLVGKRDISPMHIEDMLEDYMD